MVSAPRERYFGDMRENESDLRLAIAGTGLIGRRHAEAVARAEGVRLVAVADPFGEDWARGQGLAWHADVEALIAAARPDGLIVATPNQAHVETGLAAVAAGIPALIEKPVADTVVEAARLVEAGRAAGVPLLAGHHRRHNPLIRAAKARIEAGEIGRAVAAQATCWLYKPDAYFDVAWRTQPGAGPVFINLIHDVDLMRHLVGEIEAVQASDRNAIRGHAVEDTAAAILHFANGALGTVSVSDTVVAPWSWEMTAGENPAYPHTDQSCYQIGGTHGALSIPDGTGWTQEPRGWWEPIDRTRPGIHDTDPLVAQISHFASVIRGKETPLVSAEEGLRSLAVIEAIGRSARSGRVETVA